MRHNASDCRSDVYSLAATMYYCLLYSDAAKRGRFKAKLLPADVPADVRALLERCLDNDPDERPRDACAFVSEWFEPATGEPTKNFTNTLGWQSVLAPPATFWMGESGKLSQVEIAHYFSMGIHPVTQGQWQALMGNNPSYFSRTGGGADKVRGIADGDLKDFPVEQVSWEDAQEFIEKLNAREPDREWVYRLPTEAEWEYVCRGGAVSQADCSFDFYFEQPTNEASSRQANFDGNYPFGNASTGPYLARPTKVGSYKPNRLGIYDMHGNVWEWCQDIFEAGASDRVIRGGGWHRNGQGCRAAYRDRGGPSDRLKSVGFRLARVPAGQ
jgi:formylglycine-generating enzyme required for sulfatase activity